MDAEDGLAQPLLARGPSAPRPPPSASAPLAVPLLSGDGDDPPVAVLPAQAPLPWPAQLRRLLCEDADELAAFARLASVCALLLAGFGVARAAAALGAPPDACAERSDGGALAFDFAQLLQLGALLCWLNGLTTPRRFAWAASSHSVAPLFLVVCALFGALDRVPGLQVSLADIPAWGVTAWACMLAAGAAAAAAVAWHARLAREQLLPRAWLAYLGSRCCVCGAYVALWLTMRLSPAGRQRWVATHLHHWAVGFLLAIWGNFNADASGALLAVGAGLMTQGISA